MHQLNWPAVKEMGAAIPSSAGFCRQDTQEPGRSNMPLHLYQAAYTPESRAALHEVAAMRKPPRPKMNRLSIHAVLVAALGACVAPLAAHAADVTSCGLVTSGVCLYGLINPGGIVGLTESSASYVTGLGLAEVSGNPSLSLSTAPTSMSTDPGLTGGTLFMSGAGSNITVSGSLAAGTLGTYSQSINGTIDTQNISAAKIADGLT